MSVEPGTAPCTVGGLIGVVHLPGLPGDPRPLAGGFPAARRFANRDADALIEGGVDAIIVENFGSAPFVKGGPSEPLPHHQLAFLAEVVGDLVRRSPIPIGVNCLRNDASAAMGIAAATGASFVRVNVHTGAYVTDQGLIEGRAAETLRYRRSLDAEHVQILADVLVKHARPLGELSVDDAVQDTLARGLADGVIVSGRATGAAVDEDTLAKALSVAGSGRLFIGSGLTPEISLDWAPKLRGAIVGTWLKENGRLSAPVDASRVATFADAVRGRWYPEEAA